MANDKRTLQILVKTSVEYEIVFKYDWVRLIIQLQLIMSYYSKSNETCERNKGG